MDASIDHSDGAVFSDDVRYWLYFEYVVKNNVVSDIFVYTRTDTARHMGALGQVSDCNDRKLRSLHGN